MERVFENFRFVLASQSPRRRELLKGLEVGFRVADPYPVEEVYPAGMEGEEVPVYLAEKKARACPFPLAEDEVLVAADTVVRVGGAVLGKPKDREEAVRMLGMLSGVRHAVTTGVALLFRGELQSFRETSYVTFKELRPEEIDFYVDRFRPYDKAGAYAIQEWIGYIGIESIEGSYYNIMGLPVQRLYGRLEQLLLNINTK